ncbi:DUF6586 family protein [Pokkaliibacter sp. CJK22405]|uniref:DUF6586 family protein n=1 Tax=Pokkaliibacter sp. CJK22405 TaxID=3384615 RepID=UPI003984B10D
MSSLYARRTNQKLYFARLHLEALSQAMSAQSWHRHALIDSYQESVLFHLYAAYRAYLVELAEAYSIPAVQLCSDFDLGSLLEERGFEGPEYVALVALLESKSSWLSQLSRAYQACWQVKEDAGLTSPAASASEIQVVQVDSDHQNDEDVQKQLQGWLKNLRDIIEEGRKTLQEW